MFNDDDTVFFRGVYGLAEVEEGVIIYDVIYVVRGGVGVASVEESS